MECVNCHKEITKSQLFWGWFWKTPLRISEFSGLWEGCCSYKCYGKLLEKLLMSMAVETREVLDLSDFLFSSVAKFIDDKELVERIGKVHSTEWAKHIIAAGYRKVEPNNNPTARVFKGRDGMGFEY